MKLWKDSLHNKILSYNTYQGGAGAPVLDGDVVDKKESVIVGEEVKHCFEGVGSSTITKQAQKLLSVIARTIEDLVLLKG